MIEQRIRYFLLASFLWERDFVETKLIFATSISGRFRSDAKRAVHFKSHFSGIEDFVHVECVVSLANTFPTRIHLVLRVFALVFIEIQWNWYNILYEQTLHYWENRCSHCFQCDWAQFNLYSTSGAPAHTHTHKTNLIEPFQTECIMSARNAYSQSFIYA